MVGHRNANSRGHIVTIEDPVEYVHPHNQCVVTQREVGVDTESWHAALKNTLRQAPDVILIGEIRDRETREFGVQFAETGHLCLATLHANSANQALDRIINFFPEEKREQLLMDLSLNIKSIISQRLLRKVCETSRETFTPDESQCRLLGIDPNQAHEYQLVRGIPSDDNFHTGYSGRTGVFEILPVDDEIREAILHGKSHAELMRIARDKGMETLEEAGKRQVLEGRTTVEELLRVLTVY